MKFRSGVSWLLALSLSAGVALASQAEVMEDNFDLVTTVDLVVLCAATSEDPNFVAATYMCRGFMEGAHQYHDAMAATGKSPRLACSPEGTTLADARAVFLAWSQDDNNAGDMDEAPVVGFVRAMKAKFPCNQ